MIEMPEAIVLAQQLTRELAGKTVGQVIVAASPHGFAFYVNGGKDYEQLMAGKKIDRARAYGGKVELIMEDVRLCFNDGAALHYLAPGVKPPQKHQLLLGFDDGSTLYCTVLMYAGIMAYRVGEYENPYFEVAERMPGVLNSYFTKEFFMEIVAAAKSTLSAKALLATEQRIPGLGNGVLHDILFNARINPRSKIKALDSDDFDRMYNSVKDTIQKMTEGGGRNTEKDIYGNPGGYRAILSSKTYAYPCPACGGGITRQAFLGGNIYFCPSCQPLKQ